MNSRDRPYITSDLTSELTVVYVPTGMPILDGLYMNLVNSRILEPMPYRIALYAVLG